VEVVDSLGSKHTVTLTFTKTDANTWSYQASLPGADVTDGEAGVPYEIPDASGTLTFDDQGRLTEPAVEDGVIPISIPGLVSGAADLNVDWKLYDGQTPLVTQFAQDSASSTTSQNGAAVAEITKISMVDGGRVVAQYSSGQQVVLAQLAVAAVRNPDSLIAVGNNNFQVGPDTADPVIGVAETSGRGKIVGGALEASTVDIAREFTNLIVMQRSYQANARVITTSDELSQETLSLKR
jgi:flagellar hook protein FlgE